MIGPDPRLTEAVSKMRDDPNQSDNHEPNDPAPLFPSIDDEFSDQAAAFARLKHRDPVFRRLVGYYASLTHNVSAIESGLEPASAEFLAMLKNQQSQARAEIVAYLNQVPLY
jgi:uncharacterized protein YdcH (DUF465 family)